MFKTCSILALSSLFIVLQGQDDRPQQPVKKGRLESYDARTNEKLFDIRSEEMTPLADKRYRIKKPAGVVYTKEQDGRARRIEFTAEEGTFDETSKVLALTKDVRLQTADGESIDAQDATVTLNRERRQQKLVVRGPFKMIRTQGQVEGVDLDADLELEHYTVTRDAKIRMVDQVSNTTTDIASKGPLSAHEEKGGLGFDILHLHARDKANLHRTDNKGEAWVEADELTTQMRWYKGKPQESQRTVKQEVERLHAKGNVMMRDSRGAQARCDELRFGSEADVVDMKGAPVVGVQQQNELQAGEVQLDRVTNLLFCRNNVSARMKDSDVTSDRLKVQLVREPTGWTAAQFEATGNVVVRKADARIDCDRFLWDNRFETGAVAGKPATVALEGTRIRAPLITLRGQALCVSGPKSVVFRREIVTERSATDETVFATSRGDMVFEGNRVRMTDRAFLSGKDVRVTGDVIRVELTDDRKLDRVTAFSNLRIRTLAEQQSTVIYGDSMVSKGDLLTIFGRPDAYVVDEGQSLRSERLTFDRATGRFTASNTRRQGRIVISRQLPASSSQRK